MSGRDRSDGADAGIGTPSGENGADTPWERRGGGRMLRAWPLWLGAALVICGAAALLFLAGRGFAPGYVGDGTLTDGGFLAYPRYTIEMPPSRLSGGVAESRHVFRGVPGVAFTCGLIVRPASRVVELRESGAVIECVLSTESGEIIFDARGTIGGDWTLSEGGPQWAMLYQNRMVNIPLKPRARYILTVKVRGAEEQGIELIPRFTGGGFER